MTNLTYTLAEFGASFGISTAISSNVNADALLTALITFGVSLVTLAGGELIKFLVAFFKKKTDELNDKPKQNKVSKKQFKKGCKELIESCRRTHEWLQNEGKEKDEKEDG